MSRRLKRSQWQITQADKNKARKLIQSRYHRQLAGIERVVDTIIREARAREGTPQNNDFPLGTEALNALATIRFNAHKARLNRYGR